MMVEWLADRLVWWWVGWKGYWMVDSKVAMLVAKKDLTLVVMTVELKDSLMAVS